MATYRIEKIQIGINGKIHAHLEINGRKNRQTLCGQKASLANGGYYIEDEDGNEIELEITCQKCLAKIAEYPHLQNAL